MNAHTPAETRVGGVGQRDERTSAAYAAQVLRDRAESYWRDSRTLAADGDQPMAAAYRAVAEELRLCADILDTSPAKLSEAAKAARTIEATVPPEQRAAVVKKATTGLRAKATAYDR